jgi:signal transduction histidine kinase/DNA-binding NarL/FixJ family response regulator
MDDHLAWFFHEIAHSRSHRRLAMTQSPVLFAMPTTDDASSNSLTIQSGEMTELVRDFDWSTTPLGPMESWPNSLRTIVRMLLASRFAMWMGWGDGLTFLYNDAYARMSLGRKHPWALGKKSAEVWAEIWPDIGPRLQFVLDTGTATWDEDLLLFLERSGFSEESYHTFSYSPLTDDSGLVVGTLCVVTEATDRVINERRLASLRELSLALTKTNTEDDVLSATAHALGGNMKDLPFTAIYLADSDETTARLASATGVVPGDLAAPLRVQLNDPKATWPFAELWSTATNRLDVSLVGKFPNLPRGAWDRPTERALVLPISQPGVERPAGFLIAGANPQRPIDESYVSFLELLAGQIASSLANARAYEAERRRAEALAEIDRAKTAFFSNVSHEFRTPLTLLLGPTEDALADPTTVDANRQRLSLVHRNALRLLKLVNTLLDFSRVEAGRTQATFEPTDLSAFSADLASSFRSAAERAGLSLEVDAPPLDEPVYIDREMWEKIVLNLLSNAFKHTFLGSIRVRVRADGRSAILEVSDTGVGIPAEHLAHVFERFHRVPNARSRTHEGTGIGLAVVQELVKRHSGTITVESKEDVGTTFSVAVPLGAAHLQPERIASVPSGERAGLARAYVEEALRWLPTPPSDLGSRKGDGAVARDVGIETIGSRILVADDNADMRDYIGRLLAERGWAVHAVSNGRAALDWARAEHPDLVLSDVMMPELDGFQLLRALRSGDGTASTPVMLLSARAGEEARVEGMSAGADDYLVKPFAARELVARIETQLRRSIAATEERRLREEGNRLLAAVDAERARLRHLFAHAPAAIAVLGGPDHTFEIANEHYLNMVGGRDVIGLPIREALPELDGQGIFELLDTVYHSGEPYVGKERGLMMDNAGTGKLTEQFFTFVYQPIGDVDGQGVSAIFVHAVDVTSHVLARREAEKARGAAEQANRAKSEFLAAMSHELRTPLNAIAGYAQLLSLGVHGPITTAQHDALDRIQRSEHHLLALINDVLNFAKLEAGRVEYAIENVALAPIVADVMSMVEPQLAAKSLEQVMDVSPNLVATADAEKTRQVLINLLSNAIKFTPPGGTISVNARRREGADGTAFVDLKVTDTGVGVPPDKLESIFDPFVQVHRRLTHTTEGTGLGLSISRDLARGMHGELTVESEVGHGSIFTLSLPSGS